MDPRQFWDSRYTEADWAYSCEPNDFLREQAQQRGITIECLRCDLNDLQLKAESTDLVAAIWMHLPPDVRANCASAPADHQPRSC